MPYFISTGCSKTLCSLNFQRAYLCWLFFIELLLPAEGFLTVLLINFAKMLGLEP